MRAKLPRPERPLAFDRYILVPSTRQLLRDGKSIPLAPKAYELLAILIAQGGSAISRDALYEELWPDGFVEDGNLTQNIYVLRRALDPKGNGRRIIQTLPRHGYRFAAEIHPVDNVKRASATGVARLWWASAAAAVLIFAVLLIGGSTARQSLVPLPAEASTAYALGMYHFNMRTPSELKRALVSFDETISEAPSSALGYAGLAAVYSIEADDQDYGSRAAGNYIRLAQYYRDEALKRDPNSAEAHRVSAFLAYQFFQNKAEADREFRLALAAKPDDAETHHWHASFLFAHGKLDAATSEWELAHRLEPTGEVFSRWLGIAYVYERRPSDAIRVLSETIALQPNDHEAWLQLASAFAARGDTHRADAALEHVRRFVPHKTSYVMLQEALTRVAAHHGVADAQTIREVDRLSTQHRVGPWDVAVFFAAAGDYNRAIALLHHGRPKSLIDISMVRYDPHFDRLRSDPRFEQIFE